MLEVALYAAKMGFPFLCIVALTSNLFPIDRFIYYYEIPPHAWYSLGPCDLYKQGITTQMALE